MLDKVIRVVERAYGGSVGKAPFLLRTAGVGAMAVGLGLDFYQHEIAGLAAELESFYAPVHLLIFGGFAITALGTLLELLRLRLVPAAWPHAT